MILNELHGGENPETNTQPKPKRSRDGCQNCKEGRIKCDKTKPTCKVCQRKGLTCDYFKKLMWISVDKTDSRHPSFKNKRNSSKTYLSKGIMNEVGRQDAQTPAPRPKETETTISSSKPLTFINFSRIEESTMLDTTEEYELLSPTRSRQSSETPFRSIIIASTSSNDEVKVEESINEECIDDLGEDFTESVQIDLDTISHHGLMNLSHQRIIEAQRNFSFNHQSFPREISNIFQSKDTQNIFSHYLFVTCAFLDPLNGSGPQNISEKFFVPVAVNDPATLHGILSISGSQMSFSKPEYKRLSLLHKSLSYKHLYALLQDDKESVSSNALCAIICHLSIEIIQSGLQNWPFHIKALRKIVQERKKRKMKGDQLTWFLYLRIARYDNFATLTTGEKPLFKEFNPEDLKSFHPLIQNLDGIFGCPTTVLFFCSELTYISKTIFDATKDNKFHSLSEHLESLNYNEVNLKKRLMKVLNRNRSTINSKDWEATERIWSSSLVIHFYQTIYDVSNHDEFQSEKEKIFDALREFIQYDSFFCSNLLWPLLKISTILIDDEDRLFLKITINLFFNKTNIGAFKGVLKIVDGLWELIDNGEFAKPSDWWSLQDQKGWNIFLA